MSSEMKTFFVLCTLFAVAFASVQFNKNNLLYFPDNVKFSSLQLPSSDTSPLCNDALKGSMRSVNTPLGFSSLEFCSGSDWIAVAAAPRNSVSSPYLSCNHVNDLGLASGRYFVLSAVGPTEVYCNNDLFDGGYTLALKDLDGFENAVGMADLYDLKVVKPLVAPVDQYVSEGVQTGIFQSMLHDTDVEWAIRFIDYLDNKVQQEVTINLKFTGGASLGETLPGQEVFTSYCRKLSGQVEVKAIWGGTTYDLGVSEFVSNDLSTNNYYGRGYLENLYCPEANRTVTEPLDVGFPSLIRHMFYRWEAGDGDYLTSNRCIFRCTSAGNFAYSGFMHVESYVRKLSAVEPASFPLMGTFHHPARSCAQLHEARPELANGQYYVQAKSHAGLQRLQYCDFNMRGLGAFALSHSFSGRDSMTRTQIRNGEAEEIMLPASITSTGGLSTGHVHYAETDTEWIMKFTTMQTSTSKSTSYALQSGFAKFIFRDGASMASLFVEPVVNTCPDIGGTAYVEGYDAIYRNWVDFGHVTAIGCSANPQMGHFGLPVSNPVDGRVPSQCDGKPQLDVVNPISGSETVVLQGHAIKNTAGDVTTTFVNKLFRNALVILDYRKDVTCRDSVRAPVLASTADCSDYSARPYTVVDFYVRKI